MKKRHLFLAISITVLLAACAGQPEAALLEESTAIPEPTMAAPDSGDGAYTEEASAESGTDEAPASNDGMTAYHIVVGESTLSYEVGEVSLNQDNRFNTAIGVTSEISGTISLDGANPQDVTIGTITADISLFKSDSGKRDSTIRSRFLESAKFPQVAFTPTEILGLPENYQPGETINFQVVGEATIRDTTLPLTFDVSAVLDGDTLSGQAATIFLMSDFGFGPISIAGILNTEDEVKMDFNFVARP